MADSFKLDSIEQFITVSFRSCVTLETFISKRLEETVIAVVYGSDGTCFVLKFKCWKIAVEDVSLRV